VYRALLRDVDDLVVDEAPTPEPGHGEVLLEVTANTLCPTDVRIITGEKQTGVELPVVPGHEVAGRVAAIGTGVEGFEVGEQAALMPGVPCRRCGPCIRGLEHLCEHLRIVGYAIDGGLADHLLVPAEAIEAGTLVATHADVPAEQLALAEPLGCVLTGHAATPVRPGDTVVVLGAGPIGLLHLQAARLSGAARIVVSQPSPERRAFAERLGADLTVDPTAEDLAEAVAEASRGAGADVVFICAGHPSLVDDAIGVARAGGAVNVFARITDGGRATIDANAVHYRQVTISGSSNLRRREYRAAVELIIGGHIDTASLVTHRFSLSDIDDAIATVVARDALKVAVLP
jgi:L-iditol 2-dehydrogenase